MAWGDAAQVGARLAEYRAAGVDLPRSSSRCRSAATGATSGPLPRCGILRRHLPSSEELVIRFFAAIEASDLGTLREIYAPDAVIWHNDDLLEQSVDDNLKVLQGLHRAVVRPPLRRHPARGDRRRRAAAARAARAAAERGRRSSCTPRCTCRSGTGTSPGSRSTSTRRGARKSGSAARGAVWLGSLGGFGEWFPSAECGVTIDSGVTARPVTTREYESGSTR